MRRSGYILEISVKPSAQPTLVRTQHLPPRKFAGQRQFQRPSSRVMGSGARHRRLRLGSGVCAGQRGRRNLDLGPGGAVRGKYTLTFPAPGSCWLRGGGTVSLRPAAREGLQVDGLSAPGVVFPACCPCWHRCCVGSYPRSARNAVGRHIRRG